MAGRSLLFFFSALLAKVGHPLSALAFLVFELRFQINSEFSNHSCSRDRVQNV